MPGALQRGEDKVLLVVRAATLTAKKRGKVRPVSSCISEARKSQPLVHWHCRRHSGTLVRVQQNGPGEVDWN